MLDLEEESRYDRQERITWWSQDRLRAARVLVVGAGALGNEIVKGLALVGIGRIDVLDFDIIEPSNLARCIFFRESDRGRSKATVVAERAQELNREIVVRSLEGDVREIGTAAMADYDVAVGALDNREARLALNRSCLRSGTPWIDGAIEGLQGLVRVFRGIDEPCYECTLHAADWQDIASRRACTLLTRDEMRHGRAPTTATTSGLVGAIQAQEVVRLLHGDRLPNALGGQALVINGLTHDHFVTRYALNPECTAHERLEFVSSNRASNDETLLQLRTRAVPAGVESTVELERERVAGWICRCGRGNEDFGPLPLTSLTTGMSTCPSCSLDRTPVLLGILNENVLAGRIGQLTIRELALPSGDVVTVRTEAELQVFLTHA